MKQTIIINNPTGLHARPAHGFIKIASSLPCSVKIEKGDKTVDAKSILGLLSLGIAKGDEISIVTEGAKEEEGLKELIAFVQDLKE